MTETEDISYSGQKRDTKRRQRRRLMWLKVLSPLVVCALAALLLQSFGVFRWPWQKPPVPIVAGDIFPGTGDADKGHLSNMTPEEIKAQMQKAADSSYFSFKISARPTFKNGRSKGYVGIENPKYNIYPMVVQITLDATGEIIYDSGGILPDHHIDRAKLLKVLKAGRHKATAYLYAYDAKTKALAGKQAAALIISVEN
jgi:hypothetical protein